jgi:hypothetical protein
MTSKVLATKPPKTRWSDVATHRIFLDNLAKKLDISSPHEFTLNHILQNGGSGLLKRYNCNLQKRM